MYLHLIENFEALKRIGNILDYKIEEDCIMVTPLPAVPFIHIDAIGVTVIGAPHD